jgi:transcriptional regulator with AAA-type ATPase domain
MTAQPSVLLSWVAVNNDPYEREGKAGGPRIVGGSPVPGPTLTLLFDEESPLAGQVRDVVLLHRQASDSKDDERERRAVEETVAAIRDREKSVRVHLEPWVGDDPTDHRGIFEFLREKVPELRRRFAGRELVIHISPGTPAMHTIWVLMAETGFIEPPFRMVQSYRKAERRGRPAAVPVELGIETFYKVYKAVRPVQVSSDEQRVVWDPAKFRTARMRAVFVEARRFAHLNVPVLLLGERGTGKTTLARWIRGHSPFRREEQDARWPAVACGQYSPETMRAELFGYKKGAFTGAMDDKEGLLAAANGDTLFLDEVGDVSRDLQRLLIKALEEKQYLPLGDDHPRKSDFRLLTATNLELDELRRRLDPDFLDRVGILSLRLPPLREIREEFAWLWEVTYDEAARRAGVASRRALLGAAHHRRVVSQLEVHPLPGNLRDLFRVAYRILGARSDPHAPLPPDEAVDYGLQALTVAPTSMASPSVSREVARAFAEAMPLDAILDASSRIQTKTIERDLKAFLAGELRRLSKQRGVAIEDLCDVSERAIRTWLGGANTVVKESSDSRKEGSEIDGVPPSERGA